MPPSRSRCALLTFDLAMLMASSSSLSAAPPARPDTAPAGIGEQLPQELYLEVRINQGSSTQLARFIATGQQLSASAATLQELGLRLPEGVEPDQQSVDLAQLPDIRISYDARNQRLALQLPLAGLNRPVTQLRPATPPSVLAASDSSPGLLLNYDLHAQQQRGFRSASSFSELRLFGVGAGIWSTTQNTSLDADRGRWQRRNIRLDSRWQLDLPGPMLTLGIGDTLTGALEWSRAVRIAGVHLSRDFSLQPYRVTTPLASFSGDALLPSTVDLYINGIRQASRNVQPGRFQLDAVPTLNGSGQAQLLVTDINGQQRMLEFALYGTPTLLQAGLSDWSLDLGVLREDYGLRSFAYGDRPMASASLRHGVHQHLTIEAHTELNTDLQLAGMGAVALLGERGGVVSASFSRSRAGIMRGHQHALGYQWSAHGFSVSARTQRSSSDFRDAPAFLANALLPRRTDQFFVGLGNIHSGQFSLSYISQHYPGSLPTRLTGLGWSRNLHGNAWLSVQLQHDLDNRRTDSANLYLSLPLGRFTQLSSSVRHGSDGNALALQAGRSVPTDAGGWGWRAQASLGTRRSANAELSHLDDAGQWRIGMDYDPDAGTTGYADANGSIVWFGRSIRALRHVDDAFALVSTNGVAQVPVRLENRLIGTTDAQGQLLVAPLRAWQRNLISIDTLGLPMDLLLDTPQQLVVPASGSGASVVFRLQPSRPLRLQVRGADGKWLGVGSTIAVELAGRIVATTVTGHDGEVYLQDPPAGAVLRIPVDESHDCVIPLPTIVQGSDPPGITTLPCQP